MSVARSEYRLSNEYDARVYHPEQRGLGASGVTDVDGSPSMAIAFGWIVVSATTTYKAWRSTNGIDWSEITSAPNTAVYALAYGNNTFVAVGAAGAIYTSPGTDGSTWTARTKAGTNVNGFGFLKFLNNLFFAKQDGGNMMYSSDGITWTECSSSNFAMLNTNSLWINSKIQNLTYSNKEYIFWTCNTVATSQVRLYVSPDTAIGSGWASRSVTDTILIPYVQDDPGDGRGQVIRIGSTASANTISRFSRAWVHGTFLTTSFNNQYGTNARLFQVPQSAAATNTPLPYYSQDTQAFDLRYTDGTYFYMFPAQGQFANQSGQYGLGYMNWTEDSTPNITTSYSGAKGKFIPLYSDTSWVASQYARAKKSFQIGEKKFIWWSFVLSTGDSNVHLANNVVVLNRSIKPLKTTIDYLR